MSVFGSFSNPIVGALGRLIREAIQSANYVAGSLGWRIEQDGDAEFNNATFRGTLEVTGQDGSYIRIEDSSGTPFIELRPDDTNLAPARNYRQALIYAYSDNLADDSTRLILQSPSFDTNEGTSSVELNGEESTGRQAYVSISPRIEMPTTLVSGVLTKGTLALGTKELSQDTVSESVIDVASSAVDSAVVGAEAAILTTTGGKTYKAGCAYRVRVIGRWQPALDNRAGAWAAGAALGRSIWKVRKTNVAGQVLQDWGRMLALTPEPYAVSLETIFVVGGSDVVANLALTLASGSGAGVNDVKMLGVGTGGSRLLEIVFHDTDGTKFPNAAVLV